MQFKGTEKTSLVNSIITATEKIAAEKTCSVKVNDLHFTKIAEIDCDGNKKGLVIYVPPEELPSVQVDTTLVDSLEKHLSGYQVHIVGDRIIKPRTFKEHQLHQHTAAAVHEALFEDLVYPARMTGRRIHYSNGEVTHKFYISKNRQSELKGRLGVVSKVYEVLAKKRTKVDFM